MTGMCDCGHEKANHGAVSDGHEGACQHHLCACNRFTDVWGGPANCPYCGHPMPHDSGCSFWGSHLKPKKNWLLGDVSWLVDPFYSI